MYKKDSDNKIGICITILSAIAIMALLSCCAVLFDWRKQEEIKTQEETLSSSEQLEDQKYRVVSVVDGDTIKIDYNGSIESVRLIGVDTPESVDPRKPVQCFGIEASDYLTKLLDGKQVKISKDPTQGDRDKYQRLLRYVYLDSEDISAKIIRDGYGYEYTYKIPYAHQAAYKEAQRYASSNEKGLWAPGACDAKDSDLKPEKPNVGSKPSEQEDVIVLPAPAKPQPKPAKPATPQSCNIKGNISYSGERIYHMPGQEYYNSTQINTAYGERWFCSEAEAQAAGWRKSRV